LLFIVTYSDDVVCLAHSVGGQPAYWHHTAFYALSDTENE